jgi:hypothetical protein
MDKPSATEKGKEKKDGRKRFSIHDKTVARTLKKIKQAG